MKTADVKLKLPCVFWRVDDFADLRKMSEILLYKKAPESESLKVLPSYSEQFISQVKEKHFALLNMEKFASFLPVKLVTRN